MTDSDLAFRSDCREAAFQVFVVGSMAGNAIMLLTDSAGWGLVAVATVWLIGGLAGAFVVEWREREREREERP